MKLIEQIPTPTSQHQTWLEWNQRYLGAALDVVAARVRAHLVGDADATDVDAAEAALAVVRDEGLGPAAIDILTQMFELSGFERAIVLLCAGVELNGRFLDLCTAGADIERAMRAPSFGLALAALPGAHWSALAREQPLRRWDLIQIERGPLTSAGLRIDEQVLHFLCGVSTRNQRLEEIVEIPTVADADLQPTIYSTVVDSIATAWSERSAESLLIHLCGNDHAGKRRAALEACAELGLILACVAAEHIPASPAERMLLARLWNREVMLTGSALLIEFDPDTTTTWPAIRGFVRALRGPMLLASVDGIHDPIVEVLRVTVERPSAGQRAAMWATALADDGVEPGDHRALAATFELGPVDISRTTALARRLASEDGRSLFDALWQLCSDRARPRLRGLAEHIEPRASLDDLVVPGQVRRILGQIGAHVRHQIQVHERWGFAAKGERGLGVSALFSGPSGTGKTMAAEALAHELRLDLFRIELSAVVSKYIGETEKNLRRVFEAAETGGSILLFDEADALFGKRSEVKDSRDRYANIEVGYLLQQMEAYRGLAILTTNLRDNIDDAFLRRLRFAVRFPFPDASERKRIWERCLPASLPRAELDFSRLAQLEITGGNIRNIALIAAFLAAEEATPVAMHHFLDAAKIEYTKLDEPLSHAELVGWT